MSIRKHCGFVERHSGDFQGLPDVLAVGEGDEAGAVGGHRDLGPLWAKKRRITEKWSP